MLQKAALAQVEKWEKYADELELQVKALKSESKQPAATSPASVGKPPRDLSDKLKKAVQAEVSNNVPWWAGKSSKCARASPRG